MTREEAIFTLQEAVDESFGAGIEIITRDGGEAIEMAIEALQTHTKEYRTSRWNLMEIHNCYEVYQCEECERQITVFHRFGDSPSVADVTVDYPYCHCGAKMEVDE